MKVGLFLVSSGRIIMLFKEGFSARFSAKFPEGEHDHGT